MFKLFVSKRKIYVNETDLLVSDSRRVYPCEFRFSKDWADYEKIVRFRAGKEVHEILLSADHKCDIPWEVLLKHNLTLECGVYGLQGEDIILNTTWKDLGIIHEGAYNVDASPPKDPTPDVYQQIINTIGDLDSLTTEDKSSIVAAINDVDNQPLTNLDLEGILE